MISDVASLQDYLDIAETVFIALNTEGEITLVNKKGCELLGAEEADILGRNWVERFVPEGYRKEVAGVFKQLLTGSDGAVAQVENPVRTGEGTERIISWQNTVLEDESGSTLGVLSSGIDVTDQKTMRQALRDTERRYSELYNNVPIGIYRTTPDGRILIANDTLVQMLGFDSFEQIKRRNLEREDYEASYSRAEFKAMVERAGEVTGYEVLWHRRDGTEISVRENVRVIRDNAGQALYYEGTVEDITDLKCAMEASAFDRDLLQSLLDNAPDTIRFKDTQSRYVRINQAQMKLLGITREAAALGKTVADFYEPAYAHAVLEDEQQIIASGIPLISTIERVPGADGEERWMTTTKVPVRDTDGSVTGLVAISRDITKERELTEELRRSEEKYRTVVENLVDGLCMIKDGIVIYANEALASILGHPLKDIVGHDFMKYTAPEDKAMVAERHRRRLKGEDSPAEYEFSTIRDDHTKTIIHIRSSLLTLHGEVLTVVSVRDVTRQRRTEKLQSAIYRISEATHTAGTLEELYGRIHQILQELMPAKSMYIALYNPDTDTVCSPYYMDQYQAPPPPRTGGRGFTEYVLHHKEPFLASEHDVRQLIDDRKVLLTGHPSIDWLGVPLTYENEVIGVLTLQNYDEDVQYGAAEKEIMTFVSEQVAAAITRKQTEEQLQKLSNVVSQTGDAVLITDIEGIVEYVNPAFERLTGYHETEVCGKKADIFLYHKYPDKKAVRHILDTLLRGETYRTDYRNRKKNGEPYYLEQLITPLKDAVGRVTHFILTGRDVTERKRNQFIQNAVFRISEAANNARTLEELFAIIHETISGLMFAENFYIALWDQETNLVSYPYFVDKHDAAPPARQTGRGITEYVLRTGEPLLTSDQGLHRLEEAGEVEILGSVPTDWLGVPLKKAKQTIGVLAVQNYTGGVHYSERDKNILSFVSEQVAMAIIRKQTQADLAAERERLAVTLRSIGDGVISTDIDGRVVLMNRMAEDLTGWGQEEARDRPLSEVFPLRHEKTGVPLMPEIQEVMKQNDGRTVSGEAKLVDRRGHEKYVADSIAPLRDEESRVIGTVLVVRDITEQRLLESEAIKAQKLESIGILAGGIAHDFNNILSGILGNISLARMSFEDREKAVQLLGQAEKASKRAARLTKQLLTFSKGGAPVKETVSMKELIHESVAFALRGANVRYKLVLPDGLRKAQIDPGQIDQVLQNLIFNADQAMPEGGTILIRGQNVDIDPAHPGTGPDPGRYVKIEIEDFGEGIAPEHLDRIFDPYFTTKVSGHGLGLSTCYAIIQKHGGHIAVQSEGGQGTTMTVYLPASREPEAAEPPAPVCGAEMPAVAGSGKARILVMDDDPTVQQVAEQMLSELGYSTTIVPDGEAALATYQKAREAGYPFDAVILDLTIPGGMGGKQTMQRLLEYDRQVRGIVSSGYSTDPILAAYEAHGFCGKISKPYDFTELRQAVTSILSSESGQSAVRGSN